MAANKSKSSTKQAGEYLVAAELCRRGFVATTFTGNVPEFDILAIDEQSKKTIIIQVKTIKRGDWQFDASKFLEISQSGDIQTVRGKTKLANLDLIYVFVKLGEQNQDEFYICREKDVQDRIFEGYTEWLAEHNGKRPNKPKSTHSYLSPEYLKNYKDSWEIITESH